jgi:DNA-binding Xre family transcriptional regulator
MPESSEYKIRVKLQQARAKWCPIMSLKDLSEKTGLPYDSVKYWQYTGSIPLYALGVLCEVLEVEMEYWRV